MGDSVGAVLGVSLKMYLDPVETVEWATAVARLARRHPAVADGAVELFVLPSLPALPAVLDVLAGTGIGVGAQDLHWQDRGAVTGGVSGIDLAQLGCRYVEVHHAERRSVFGEDEAVASAKLAAALRAGLTPVVCVGEREPGHPTAALADCTDQLRRLLEGSGGSGERIVVAYEPEWAIGASQPASPMHVRNVIGEIKVRLRGHPLVHRASVIYGGSAGPGLLTALNGSVDGLFLGRFAHDARALEAVLDECSELAMQRVDIEGSAPR